MFTFNMYQLRAVYACKTAAFMIPWEYISSFCKNCEHSRVVFELCSFNSKNDSLYLLRQRGPWNELLSWQVRVVKSALQICFLLLLSKRVVKLASNFFPSSFTSDLFLTLITEFLSEYLAPGNELWLYPEETVMSGRIKRKRKNTKVVISFSSHLQLSYRYDRTEDEDSRNCTSRVL